MLKTRVTHALSRSGLPDIDYALNPYIGCSHACTYCYARLYTRHEEASRYWGEVVVVKENIVDVLKREVRIYKPGVVGLSTITDPYQPVEAFYKLTRESIKILTSSGFHVSIQTKNTLVIRDLDVLVKYKDRVDVGFTITTLDDNLARVIEPYSSPPTTRAWALKTIAGKGVETWIFYGPVIPGLNDDDKNIQDILALAGESGSKVLVDYLHVKPFMKNPKHPLYDRISMVTREWWRKFIARVRSLCEKENVECIIGYAEPVKNTQTTLDKYLNL